MGHFFQFRIDERNSGGRVDEFFASRFGSLSRMRIASLIDSGACVVNGAAARAGYRFVAGDCVEVSFDDGAPTAMSPEPIPLEIVFEDAHLLVVVKPAEMLVHPTMSVKTGTLANALAYHLNKSSIEDGGSKIENSDLSEIDPQSSVLNPQPVTRPGIVHRLDRATSGLMVIAKTPRALTVLSNHFRKRLVSKRYLASVHGSVEAEAGSIIAPIGRDPTRQPQWRVLETGRPAETRFKVLDRMERTTLLELEPVTGRTNQLRIHCAHIGHPIVGDNLHCGLQNADCELTSSGSQKDQSAIRDSQFAVRLCLHAWKLAFHHPASGEWMEFASPLPAAMAAMVERHSPESAAVP